MEVTGLGGEILLRFLQGLDAGIQIDIRVLVERSRFCLGFGQFLNPAIQIQAVGLVLHVEF